MKFTRRAAHILALTTALVLFPSHDKLKAQPPPGFMRPATAEELAPLEAALSACLDRQIRAEEGTVIQQNNMTVAFDWHEDNAARRMRYMMAARFDMDAGEWVPAALMITGEQILENSGTAITFTGDVNADELRQVAGLVEEFLADNAGEASLSIETLLSSRQPDLACAGLGQSSNPDQGARTHYQVVLSQPAPPPVRPDNNRRGFFSPGGGDRQYNLWLLRDGTGGPVIKEIECMGSVDECDRELIRRLGQAIPDPVEPEVVAARERAVNGAIPPSYRVMNEPVLIRQMMMGFEHLNAFLVVDDGSGREGSASVNCTRPLDGSRGWECTFRPPMPL